MNTIEIVLKSVFGIFEIRKSDIKMENVWPNNRSPFIIELFCALFLFLEDRVVMNNLIDIKI